MKGKVAKKPVYQPPKLKTRTKWMAPPEDHDPESSENVVHNPLPNNKSKNPKKKKSPRKSDFNTLDLNNSDFNDDPNVEFKTGKITTKNDDPSEGIQYGTTGGIKINTMTTFSRLDEEKLDVDDPTQYDAPYEQPPGDDRVPCPNCGRKFNPDRLPVHMKSCNKMKKRSIFNSKNKRVAEGMGKFETPTKKSQQNKSSTTKQKSKTTTKSEKSAKWKRDHNELMKAIKMSRLIKKVEQEGGDISKIPVAPSEPNEDFVECKYCYRRFAPNTAERHIPKCKDMINRPKPPPHILKRLKQEEAEKKSRQERCKNRRNEDMKRMTANAFGAKLQTNEDEDEGMKTQYPFKPPLRKIKEENEDGPYKNAVTRENTYMSSESKNKRGQSVNSKYMQSNGFNKSSIANNTSYQSNFQETAISTSTSKNFMASPMHGSEKPRKSYKRSESLIARSANHCNVS